jgi:hypothetical protein
VQQMHSDDSTPFASPRCNNQQITGPVDVSVLVRCSMYLLRETLPRGRENFDVGRREVYRSCRATFCESIRETPCSTTLAVVKGGRLYKDCCGNGGMDQILLSSPHLLFIGILYFYISGTSQRATLTDSTTFHRVPMSHSSVCEKTHSRFPRHSVLLHH